MSECDKKGGIITTVTNVPVICNYELVTQERGSAFVDNPPPPHPMSAYWTELLRVQCVKTNSVCLKGKQGCWEEFLLDFLLLQDIFQLLIKGNLVVSHSI